MSRFPPHRPSRSLALAPARPHSSTSAKPNRLIDLQQDLLSSLPNEALCVLLANLTEYLPLVRLMCRHLRDAVDNLTPFVITHDVNDPNVLFKVSTRNPRFLWSLLNQCHLLTRVPNLHTIQVLLAVRYPTYLSREQYRRFWKATLLTNEDGRELVCPELTNDNETLDPTDPWLQFLYNDDLRQPYLRFNRIVNTQMSAILLRCRNVDPKQALIMYSLSARPGEYITHTSCLEFHPALKPDFPRLVFLAVSYSD